MAQKVNIILVDDLDGSDASQNVSFGLDRHDVRHLRTTRTPRSCAMPSDPGHARMLTSSRKRKGSTTNAGPSARELRATGRALEMFRGLLLWPRGPPPPHAPPHPPPFSSTPGTKPTGARLQ